MLMDFNNSFRSRMGGEDRSNVQFNPKLWNLRPVVKGSKNAAISRLGRSHMLI